MKFHEVWMIVLPKKKAEAAARNELAKTKAKLAELMTRIQVISLSVYNDINMFMLQCGERREIENCRLSKSNSKY